MSLRNSATLSRRTFRLGLTAAVSGVALLIGCEAHAQAKSANAPAAGDDTVVVITGQRKAMQSAQTIKRKNDLIVDSIVAEDVGKLPDNNVADALARVTGIQVRRDSGEANSVLIRGLPNVVTLLNGREVFTTSGRYIALADVPATMLSRVDAYKTASPEQIEGGIAGAIDVRTRRPFDFPGFQLSANARAVYSDKAKHWDPDLGATISNRWDTGAGEVGALLGISTQERNYHEERAFNIRWTDQSGAFNGAHPAPAAGFKGPFVMGYIPIEGDRKRDAINFALQWRPDADTELYAEGFASDYKNKFELDFLVGLPFLGDGNISGTVFPGTNLMKTLINHNVFTIDSTQANDQHTLTQQYSVGGSKVMGQYKFSTDLSYTGSKFDFQNPIMDTGVVVPLVQVDTSHDGYAQLNYGGPNFSMKDPTNFSVVNFFDQYGTQKGKSLDWRADVAYTPASDGILRSLSAGVRFADRNASNINAFGGGAYGFPSPSVNSIPGLNGVSAPMAAGKDYITNQWYTPSAAFLLANTDVVRKLIAQTYFRYNPVTHGGTTASQFAITNDPVTGKRRLDPGSFFADKEVTTAIYGQAKLAGDLGAVPWSALLGVRVIQTEQTLIGENTKPTPYAVPYNTSNLNAPENFYNVYTETKSTNKTTDVLPSVNVKFTLRPDLIARVSAGRTVTRPDFAQLNPGLSFSVLSVTSSNTNNTANGGNPNLKQVKSDNFDGSLEWYFAADGFISAAYFHRDINGYIDSGTPTNTVVGNTTYLTTRPANSGKDKLDGMEFDYRQFYDNLPGVLSGLGLEANMTVMDGNMTNAQTNAKSDFRGLSKLSYNIIALYEKGPWSGRLAYNWRSKFLDTPNFEGDTVDLIVADTSVMDGSIAYKLSPNVTLTLEGNNLLDTDFHDYFKQQTDGRTLPRDLRRYDRTILLGLRFKM